MRTTMERTFKFSEVTLTNVETKEVIESYKVNGTITKKQVMKDYLKSCEDVQPVLVEIKETEEKRVADIDDFLKISKVTEINGVPVEEKTEKEGK